MRYDLIIENANIISMAQKQENCSWIAVKDGIIAEMGSERHEGNADKMPPGIPFCRVLLIVMCMY